MHVDANKEMHSRPGKDYQERPGKAGGIKSLVAPWL